MKTLINFVDDKMDKERHRNGEGLNKAHYHKDLDSRVLQWYINEMKDITPAS